ncbi:MAG: nucleoside transporter C-terminal domain-containing protein [Selenomonadaceae bacterium]|nr:nucleoside transporter C-terminal domain-containing protein [Selenomonadaceae bacterium]
MGIILNLLGIALVIGIAYAVSYDRKKINWKMIGKALLAQFILAIIVIKVPAGVWVIEEISNLVTAIVGFGKAGLEFVFGSFMDIPKTGFVFIIHVLSNIIFIGALVSVLTYLGILGFVIKHLGAALGKVIGTSRVESFICVANMFLGQTESPLLIAKYLKNLTNSEILMILIAGMGSMSVSILGGYNAMGVPMQLLILASSLVPFGSIVLGKIILPEKEENESVNKVDVDRHSAGSNVIEAMSNGALDGWMVVMAIASSLVAINGMVALIDGGLSFAGLELKQIFGWIFYPVAFLMGLDASFTDVAGQILGCKLILNEFVAYDMLMPLMDTLDYRAQAVMCITIGGFANVGSMAVCVSALGSLCPERKPDVAKLIVRALAGAFALNIMNGMIVGIILSF